MTSSKPRGLLALALITGLLMTPSARANDTLLNVSYDPTREFYKDFNAAFTEHWTAEGGAPVTIRMSHGGSGKQARSVIDGLDADVVTLAISVDIDRIAEATGAIPADWQDRLPDASAPYTSTIVFLVRKGNPKDINDWDDLLRDDVQVVTPNPKTSGGARWNYLAAWIYAEDTYPGDETRVRDFMARLYRNVPVLDTGARGSTITFTQRGIGDVLLAWENEAFLSRQKMGADQFDIVVPSVSVRAEPPVTVVTGNTERRGTTALATAYLEYLYSETGQTLAARHFYRPARPDRVPAADLAPFPEVTRVRIADRFGSWAAAQAIHFADGGVFDQITGAGH
ncbi:sulfate ABC transporter substrate-binding protein [Roseospira marina]|uniref:Sulfate ABC transporter substrate-binding protein n=1 Tax=Roseospira marina TaxID=140057 RepID=A0A5M6I7P8_9PROT|nr:sulfate ABC transporter substrate-binding protein [Roseospira marina]KAA5604250.1 sulfate ABC transporter substrate-binding protein [Roseospira marina]MBB4315603.1 sulfate transport system substrate-binding protein [Roseospira marina]MBB5088599.1 sulfate transport system substrate-binding protein [Roseospira marina]